MFFFLLLFSKLLFASSFNFDHVCLSSILKKELCMNKDIYYAEYSYKYNLKNQIHDIWYNKKKEVRFGALTLYCLEGKDAGGDLIKIFEECNYSISSTFDNYSLNLKNCKEFTSRPSMIKNRRNKNRFKNFFFPDTIKKSKKIHQLNISKCRNVEDILESKSKEVDNSKRHQKNKKTFIEDYKPSNKVKEI